MKTGLQTNWVFFRKERNFFVSMEIGLKCSCFSPPSEWLRMIGLPGYVRTFVEARIDGHMLNVISMVTDHMTSFVCVMSFN